MNKPLYIINENGRHFKVTNIKPEHYFQKVYRYNKSSFLLTHKFDGYLFNLEDWETCYYNIEGKETAIKGQICPSNSGFKPSETDDTYFDNRDNMYKKGMNFHDNTIGIGLLLKELP